MSVKKQAAAYLLSIDPETERLQVKKNKTLIDMIIEIFFFLFKECD
jgi:hypothetical protein